MTKSMQTLKDTYDKFMSIGNDYCGKKTDWIKASNELELLYRSICGMILTRSPNILFEEYIRRGLRTDIFNEWRRVDKIITESK